MKYIFMILAICNLVFSIIFVYNEIWGMAFSQGLLFVSMTIMTIANWNREPIVIGNKFQSKWNDL